MRLLYFDFFCGQREYEEFKVRINGLVALAQRAPEEGWTMQDGTLWPGNNVRDHPGMFQVNKKKKKHHFLRNLIMKVCYDYIMKLLSEILNILTDTSWTRWRG